jgi:hypothetical protein
LCQITFSIEILSLYTIWNEMIQKDIIRLLTRSHIELFYEQNII